MQKFEITGSLACGAVSRRAECFARLYAGVFNPLVKLRRAYVVEEPAR